MGIYTKTGDKGETSLVDGQRAPKSDLRIDLYGDIDELNSFIGLARSNVSESKPAFVYLESLQSILFNIGSNIACPVESREKFSLPQLEQDHLQNLEDLIDSLEGDLSPLKNFILPAGSALSSQLHVCRSISRRVERKLIAFVTANKNERDDLVLKFINRLSDFFFVLARYANKLSGVKDVEWNKDI